MENNMILTARQEADRKLIWNGLDSWYDIETWTCGGNMSTHELPKEGNCLKVANPVQSLRRIVGEAVISGTDWLEQILRKSVEIYDSMRKVIEGSTLPETEKESLYSYAESLKESTLRRNAQLDRVYGGAQ